jgi:hypothetical protein
VAGWQRPAALSIAALERLCPAHDEQGVYRKEVDESRAKSGKDPAAFTKEECAKLWKNLAWRQPANPVALEKPPAKPQPKNSKTGKKPPAYAAPPSADPAIGCAHKSECKFDDEADLLEAIEAENEHGLGHSLTDKQEEAVLTHAEHLVPDNPFESHVHFFKILLAGLALLLPALNGLAVFGLSAPQMFQPLLARLGLSQPGSELRFYESRFKHLVRALGPKLVIFIDDLDRCEPAHAMRVLETTNFLTSAGACFFVLGMAPRFVTAAVGLHFKELASEVVSETPDGKMDKEEEERHERETFAREYLRKLINVEVPVPEPRVAKSFVPC